MNWLNAAASLLVIPSICTAFSLTAISSRPSRLVLGNDRAAPAFPTIGRCYSPQSLKTSCEVLLCAVALLEDGIYIRGYILFAGEQLFGQPVVGTSTLTAWSTRLQCFVLDMNVCFQPESVKSSYGSGAR